MHWWQSTGQWHIKKKKYSTALLDNLQRPQPSQLNGYTSFPVASETRTSDLSFQQQGPPNSGYLPREDIAPQAWHQNMQRSNSIQQWKVDKVEICWNHVTLHIFTAAWNAKMLFFVLFVVYPQHPQISGGGDGGGVQTNSNKWLYNQPGVRCTIITSSKLLLPIGLWVKPSKQECLGTWRPSSFCCTLAVNR